MNMDFRLILNEQISEKQDNFDLSGNNVVLFLLYNKF